MPIGIVSDEEFEAQLLNKASEDNNLLNKRVKVIINDDVVINNELTEESIELPSKGRNGSKEVPESLRKLIAGEAIVGVSAIELSEVFNVSKSSVSAYKNGATSTSTYNNPDEALKLHNDGVRSSIVGMAQSKLIEAINEITAEKLRDAKVNIAASVARDMSSIVKNISPSNEGGSNNNNKVIIYKPRMKEEDDYDVIVVSD